MPIKRAARCGSVITASADHQNLFVGRRQIRHREQPVEIAPRVLQPQRLAGPLGGEPARDSVRLVIVSQDRAPHPCRRTTSAATEASLLTKGLDSGYALSPPG